MPAVDIIDFIGIACNMHLTAEDIANTDDDDDDPDVEAVAFTTTVESVTFENHDKGMSTGHALIPDESGTEQTVDRISLPNDTSTDTDKELIETSALPTASLTW
eukprot:gene2285-biopygen1087